MPDDKISELPLVPSGTPSKATDEAVVNFRNPDGSFTTMRDTFAKMKAFFSGDKENTGVAQSLLNTHVGQADPHPQYALDTDLSAYATTDWVSNWAEPKILRSTRTTNYRLDTPNHPSQIIRNGGTSDIGIQTFYTNCKINGAINKTVAVKPNQLAFIKAIQNSDDNYFVFVVDEIPVDQELLDTKLDHPITQVYFNSTLIINTSNIPLDYVIYKLDINCTVSADTGVNINGINNHTINALAGQFVSIIRNAFDPNAYFIYVFNEMPSSGGGGGIPEPTTAGNFLRNNLGAWVEGVPLSIYNANVNTLKHAVKYGEAITKGQAVYPSSADGTNIVVSLASNATEATSSKTLGLATTTGALNAMSEVITDGFLGGLNTSTATLGDPVWLGVGGNLIYGLTNKPIAPAHLVYIGVVTRVSATVGEILVKVQNGFELKEIHDVLLGTLVNNDVLVYENSTGLWKNKQLDVSMVTNAWAIGGNAINAIASIGSTSNFGVSFIANNVKQMEILPFTNSNTFLSIFNDNTISPTHNLISRNNNNTSSTRLRLGVSSAANATTTNILLDGTINVIQINPGGSTVAQFTGNGLQLNSNNLLGGTAPLTITAQSGNPSATAGSGGIILSYRSAAGSFNPTSGLYRNVQVGGVQGALQPTGSASYIGADFLEQINQTTGTGAITYININPTITSNTGVLSAIISNIATGANRYNLNITGTAINYLAGNTSIGTTTASSLLTLGGSTTARSSLRLLAGTAPTTPNDGDIWYDGTNIYLRVGSTTKTFTTV